MEAPNAALGFLVVALPFLAAGLAHPLWRRLPRAAPALLALAPLAAFLILCGYLPGAARRVAVVHAAAWVPSLDVRFALRLDALSVAFGLLVTGIGALVLVYSGAYLGADPRKGRFLAFMLLFMGAMLGLVLADDLVLLFVFWEATSIASFLLIGFDHERAAARRAAVQALAITGGGGLALLAAVLILRGGLGLSSLSQVLAAGGAVREAPVYGAVLALVLGAAFTKSAQVPFNVWLPNAMEAPTPVSAYLHSATMVKAGIYLLMRLNPALGGTPAWETVLPLFGGATLLVGAVLAVAARDIKIVLAQTTVASLGLLVLLIGAGGETAIAAAVLYLLAHALFKGGLFMAAGAVDHGAGTRDLAALRGLRRAMPATFAASLLCALSMAGVTPFLGFLAKEEVYEALAGGSLRALALTAAAVAGNALMVAAAALVAWRPFAGAASPAAMKTRPTDPGASVPGSDAHEAPAGLLLGPLALGLLGLAAALFSAPFHRLFTDPVASLVAGAPVTVTLGVVPHLGLAFALSLGTIALGLFLYACADAVARSVARLGARSGWSLDRGFDRLMEGLLRAAVRLTGLFQPGRLDAYVALLLATLAGTLLVAVFAGGALPAVPAVPAIGLAEALLSALALAGVAAVLAARSRLAAIVALGIQGMAVTLLFLAGGAPDLAFTQGMVETLSLVILALAIVHLNLEPEDRRPKRWAVPAAVLAGLLGAGFGGLLLAIGEMPFDDRLSRFYAAMSYPLGHGRNIVNVILVDFRGLDTLGEGAVVLTAGIAILALLRIRVRSARGQAPESGS